MYNKWKDEKVLRIVEALLISKHSGTLQKTYEQIASELNTLFPGYTFTGEAVRSHWKKIKDNVNLSGSDFPKVLLFDIETLPMHCYVWRLGKQVLNHEQILKDWCVLSWAAKWLNGDEYYHDILSADEVVNHNDQELLKGMWELLEDSDIVIGHNSRRFDHRVLNARFIYHGMKPTTPFQTIDTLKQAKSIAWFTSNKLDYLGEFLRNKKKIKTNFQLWKDCDNGDKKALKKMMEYNIHDVALLEEVYYELRPWMKSHPNMGIYVDGDESVCASCASTNLEWKGYYTTSVGKYRSYRCLECGAIGRARKTSLDLDKRKSLTVSVAR